MKEAFIYQVALRILDWILEDSIRATAAVLLVPLLGIACWLLRRNTPLRKGSKSRSSGLSLTRKISTLPTWGKWLSATVVLGSGLWLAWIAVDAAHVVSTASHLSWQATEFYRARCVASKASSFTGEKQRAEIYMPTMMKYEASDQHTLVFMAVHELAQKGIIEDRPLHRISRETPTQDLPPNILPTPFGERLCLYYLTVQTQ